jgi:hypothetical protein
MDPAVQDGPSPRKAGLAWPDRRVLGEEPLDGTQERAFFLGAEPGFAQEAEAVPLRGQKGQVQVGAAHIGGQNGVVNACNHRKVTSMKI